MKNLVITVTWLDAQSAKKQLVMTNYVVFTEYQTAKQLIESELARRIASTFSFLKDSKVLSLSEWM